MYSNFKQNVLIMHTQILYNKKNIHTILVKLVLYIFIYILTVFTKWKKTRRGSPVDDRPSTDKLHHFAKKKKKKKKKKIKKKKKMGHVTCDT